ncbi:MAG TPA: FAD-binding oxidoreductase [Streptosporangiaceae bacterium]|nr:FAD-binding oxidoreductase [Streptosporangiaceae bacterium]
MDADIAVIGAGALGLSTALHCARRGRSVVVVDREAAGSQASGRAAGLFKSVQADQARTVLARRSIELAAHFEEWAGVPLAVQRTGSFLVARTAQHQAFLRAELAQSRRWGVDVREASPAELAERAPYYQPSGTEQAVWCPEDVYIEEPAALMQAYLSACRRHGAQICENEPAVTVLTSGGRVTGLETTSRRIMARTVVDAAGAWVRQVGELARAWIPVAPVRHQLLITEPSDSIQATDPIVRVVDAATYLRPARGGLMLGVFETDPLPVDPRRQPAFFTTDDVPLDLGPLQKAASQIGTEVPLAGRGPVAEHRGGLFTMSPDGRFVAGPVPDVPGLWVASGCNGSGFSSSPALGEMLATAITEDSAGPSPVEFSPGRFGRLTDAGLTEKGVWQYAHYYDPAPGPRPPF